MSETVSGEELEKINGYAREPLTEDKVFVFRYPSPTDFYVHLNIARYVFSRSKHFEQPRKRLALAGGGLTLRSREASQTCGAVPQSGGLCRQTAKSKVI